jgi:hypothetical protein
MSTFFSIIYDFRSLSGYYLIYPKLTQGLTYNFKNVLLVLRIVDPFDIEYAALCAVLLVTPQFKALVQEYWLLNYI